MRNIFSIFNRNKNKDMYVEAKYGKDGKVIIWKNYIPTKVILDGKNVDVRITSLYIDGISGILTVVGEVGVEVTSFNISMECAQDIGLINLNVLDVYFKKYKNLN